MIKKALWLSLLAGSASFAQETSGAASKLAPGGATFFTWLAITCVAGMVLVGIGIGFAQSMAARRALDGAARQPSSADKLMTQMLIALVFMETMAIYALLVVFLMLFVNPFAKFFVL